MKNFYLFLEKPRFSPRKLLTFQRLCVKIDSLNRGANEH